MSGQTCPDCYGRGTFRRLVRVPGTEREHQVVTCASCKGAKTIPAGSEPTYRITCPLCSEPTPDHLMCACDDTACTDCHGREHDRECEDCHGRGSINVTRRARAKYGAYIPSEAIGPNGYELSATCATCDGLGRTNT